MSLLVLSACGRPRESGAGAPAGVTTAGGTGAPAGVTTTGETGAPAGVSTAGGAGAPGGNTSGGANGPPDAATSQEGGVAIQDGDATGPVNVGDGGPLVFFDDFNGTALGSAWTALNRAGDYTNPEQECYLPAQVTVSGGNLIVTTSPQNHTCGDQGHSPSQFSFVSGMVQWTSFNFQYGTMEFRARSSGGRGSWPAIWLVGSQCQASNILTADNVGTCNWPNHGSEELDVLEMKYNNFTTVWHNLIVAAGTDTCLQSTTDTSQNFHLYTMHWGPGVLTFSIDGQPAPNCNFHSQRVPDTPMFLIINNAVATNAPVIAADYPQTFEVDYVKVTQP